MAKGDSITRPAVLWLLLGAALAALVWGVPHALLFRAAAFFSADGDPASLTERFTTQIRWLLSGLLVAACVVSVLAHAGPRPVRRALVHRYRAWVRGWMRPAGWGRLLKRFWRRPDFSRGEAAAFSVVLLAGIACRVLVYARQPLYNDEAFTLTRFVLFPFPGALWQYAANNHPLSTLLANVAYTIGGPDLAVVRLPALLAGCGVLIAVFVLTQRRCGFGCALMAMTLAGGAGQLVDYSARVRGYSLVTLLVLWACIEAGRAVASQGRRGVLGTGAACALAHFAMPSALYATAGVFVYLLVACCKTRRVSLCAALLEAGAVCAGLTLVFYAPILILGGLEPILDNRWVAPISPPAYGTALVHMAGRVVTVWQRCTPLLTFGLGVLGCIVAVFTFRSQPHRRLPLLPCLLVGALAVSLATRTVAYPRTYNFLLPLVCAAGALGLSVLMVRLSRRFRYQPKTLMAGAAVALALYQAGSYALTDCQGGQDHALDQPRRAALFLAQETAPEEPIALASPYDASIVYYGRLVGLDPARTDPAQIRDRALLVWDEGISYPADAIAFYDLLRLDGVAERVHRLEPLAQFGKTHIARVWLRPLETGTRAHQRAVHQAE